MYWDMGTVHLSKNDKRFPMFILNLRVWLKAEIVRFTRKSKVFSVLPFIYGNMGIS